MSDPIAEIDRCIRAIVVAADVEVLISASQHPAIGRALGAEIARALGVRQTRRSGVRGYKVFGVKRAGRAPAPSSSMGAFPPSGVRKPKR